MVITYLASEKGFVSKRVCQPNTTGPVNALRALPVDKVRLSPGILVQVPLQFALFVENQLRRRIKNLASFRWPETGSESLLPFKICNLQIPYDEENTESDRMPGCAFNLLSKICSLDASALCVRITPDIKMILGLLL